MPEAVDWLGQRTQIDLAKKHGLQQVRALCWTVHLLIANLPPLTHPPTQTHRPPQVVLVSSMGVTKPEHPLNCIGGGKILMWKRMAEEYLVNSGECSC